MNCLFGRKICTWTVLAFFIGITIIIPNTTSGENEPSLSNKISDSKTHDYQIGAEDVLEISVWKNAELSKEVIVRPDGKISLPLIGDVHAAGNSPDKLRQLIVEKLKEYQDTVVVSVIVQQVNSYKIFILGEVASPGVYILKNKSSLLQAIAMAGGFNQFASKNKIVVIRQKKDGTDEEEKISIRFDNIVDKDEKSSNNLILRPGDTIFVP